MEYNKYIGKLKARSSKIDFDQMEVGIESKIHLRPKLRLAVAGALAILLIGFFSYLNIASNLAANDDLIMAYVFESESINGEVTDYIFDDGTF